jgi:dipeptidyl aminopeptidase/acylaminoacyl peptidase
MARIGASHSPSFSPNGQRLAFISNLGGRPQLWTIRVTGGWPDLVTTMADPVVAAEYSPVSNTIAFSVAPGGGLNQQIYVVSPDDNCLRRLTEGSRENNWLEGWTRDGRYLRVTSNRDRPEGMDSYLVDVDSGEWQLVARHPGLGRFADVDAEGLFGIVLRQANRGDNDLVLVRLSDRTEMTLTPHVPPASFLGGHFGADGRSVYFASNAETDRLVFVRMALGHDGLPLTTETLASRTDADLEDFAISDDGTLCALLWNVGGRSQLVLTDLRTNVVSGTPDLPAEVASQPVFSPDGRYLALTCTGSVMPRDIWLVDIATGDLIQATHSPRGSLEMGSLVRPELVRFAAHDELELTAWLYLPSEVALPAPLVVNFHGGPELQERPVLNSTYQAILSAGIAVLAPNVRGSAGFGKRFSQLDNGALRFDAIRDIETCVDFVVTRGIADRQRIGIMGGSYGGYMTLAGLVAYPHAFAAAVDICGMVNFETFFAHTEAWVAAISRAKYGDPATEADLLRRLSPIHRIDRVRAPTLVVHGANDTNVPVVEAEQVVSSLSEHGVPVELLLFEDEGHGVLKLDNRIRTITSVVRWFARYLRGEEATE